MSFPAYPSPLDSKVFKLEDSVILIEKSKDLEVRAGGSSPPLPPTLSFTSK